MVCLNTSRYKIAIFFNDLKIGKAFDQRVACTAVAAAAPIDAAR